MITGLRVYLAPGCEGDLYFFTRALGDQYYAATMPSSTAMEPSVLDDWLETSDANCIDPEATPATIAQTSSEQRIYWETVWNQTNSCYQQLQIEAVASNTYTQDIWYDDYSAADVTTKLMAIEGLLHAKYPQADFADVVNLYEGDNQYDVPSSGDLKFNPIGALVKITTRGAGVNPWNSEPDTGAFGWIANIYDLNGSQAGVTAFGGKQYLFFETQIIKLEQI